MQFSCDCLNIMVNTPPLQRSSSVNSSDGARVGFGEGNGGTFLDSVKAILCRQFRPENPRLSDSTLNTQFLSFLTRDGFSIPELSITKIKVPELLFAITLDSDEHPERWHLVSCINCKQVVCGSRLPSKGSAPAFIVNRTLLISNDEVTRRQASKSYSETFDLLIKDNLTGSGTIPSSESNLIIGSLSSNFLDGRSQRVRLLVANQQARVQEEIAKTNERIECFTQKEFQLLNSYREKSNQDCAYLMRLINQVPEQDLDLMDNTMISSLEGAGNWLSAGTVGGGGARGGRRNTIGSRRDLNVPTTPNSTSTLVQPPNYQTLPPQQQLQPLVSGISAVLSGRKMSNFDTPPATPEATPMSVGNSPTFRQQAGIPARHPTVTTNSSTSASGGIDEADDCLFDLEDEEDIPTTPKDTVQAQSNFNRSQLYQQQQHHQHHYQRLQHQQLDNSMDNVGEGEDADEAEYAVDLDSSLPIPMRGSRPTASQLMNFARSLPIEISNSPLAERANNNFVEENNEEVLDNIDIAASIKALAKSVHGEAVFGDLPRPRLSSQI